MANGIYTQKVIEHFRNPHNYGKMKNPDSVGEVGNLTCGDVMKLYIKIEKDKKGEEVIKAVSFETFGCAAALATSSVVTDLAKRKTIKQALKITNKDVVKALGDLPAIKIHCSLLAEEALSEAIYDYLSKNKREIPQELERKHQKIKKEKKILEKRYEKWLK